jgi:hypothetical protein
LSESIGDDDLENSDPTNYSYVISGGRNIIKKNVKQKEFLLRTVDNNKNKNNGNDNNKEDTINKEEYDNEFEQDDECEKDDEFVDMDKTRENTNRVDDNIYNFNNANTNSNTISSYDTNEFYEYGENEEEENGDYTMIFETFEDNPDEYNIVYEKNEKGGKK